MRCDILTSKFHDVEIIVLRNGFDKHKKKVLLLDIVGVRKNL